jgi:hypothetical protein
MKKTTLGIAIILFWCGSLAGIDSESRGESYVLEKENVLILGNSYFELLFQLSDGRLVGFKDRKKNVEFIKETNAYWSPFDFIYRIGGQEKCVGGWLAKSFHYIKRSMSRGLALDLIWTQFSAEGRVIDIKVTVTIKVEDNSSLSEWAININNNENITLEQVDFPAVHGLGPLSSDPNKDFLAYPSLCGLLFQDPLHNFITGRGWGVQMYYPSGYSTMQFMAYYGLQSKTGLYIACLDGKTHSKYFVFSKPESMWLSASVNHIPEFIAGSDYHSDFPIVMGPFSGDWYDAAQLYRTWALGQNWASRGSLAARIDIPGWFPMLGLRQFIYTHPNNLPDWNLFRVVPEVTRDTSLQMKSPAIASWIGWERTGWYIEYPDVFPPKEGWTAFRQAVNDTHQKSNRVLFIPDTTSYSEVAPSWTLAKPSACRDSLGSYLNPVSYSEAGRETRLIPMCPAADFWNQKLKSMLSTLSREKADVIQLDGFPIFGPQPCAVGSHGHPKGGGTWWYDKYHKLFSDFIKKARKNNAQLILTSEGMAEAYLDFLDSFWDPFTTGWSPAIHQGMISDITKASIIPLWQTVYHDYAFLESGISFLSRHGPSGAVGYGDYRDYYVRGFALALIWGELPTTWYYDEKISELDEQGERDMANYLRRIVEARTGYARSYLVYGRMLRPPSLKVPVFLVKGAKRIPYSLNDYPPFQTPTVLGSAWKNPKGEAAFVLTNISRKEVVFKLPISCDVLMIEKDRSYTIIQYRNGAKSVLKNNVLLPQTLTIRIRPQDVIVIEVTSRQTGRTREP